VQHTRYGGHCGFLSTLFGPAWCDHYVLEQFERFSVR
jgi:predicted alpha/beta-fold hydrolase